MSSGNEGCRCIDNSAILASLSERSCQIRQDGRGMNGTTSQDGIMLTVEGPCVPHTIGSNTCLQYGLLHDPSCSQQLLGETTVDPNCYRPWCYVDAKECMEKSDERVYRSDYFGREDGIDIFYSYTTCDKSVDDWSSYQSPKSLGGITIEAVVPRYMDPFMFKRSTTFTKNQTRDEGDMLSNKGSEYYDNSVPYEGAIIDYFDDLIRIADGDFDISYTFGSKSSNRIHPKSSFTAAVQDIEDGLADASIGPFWISGQRLKMASFTVPIYYSRTVLVIKQPGTDNDLGDEISKVFDPFEWRVWLLIVAFIILTALLSLWFSDSKKVARKKFGDDPKTLTLSDAKHPMRLRKSVFARLLLDEILQKGIFFCSAGIEQDSGASLPSKLLSFGFAFFILILVSAYVANLAAFLTRSPPIQISTMEDAVEARLKICAYDALKVELEAAWPTAKSLFVFSASEYDGLFSDFDDEKCEVLALPTLDLSPNIEIEKGLCRRNLIYTQSLVIENPVAIPIRSELAAGLSFWMYQGEKYHGITIATSLEKYEQGKSFQCNLELKNMEADDYTPISVQNLLAPIIFFIICVSFAVAVQLYHQRALRRGHRSNAGRHSSLPVMLKPRIKGDKMDGIFEESNQSQSSPLGPSGMLTTSQDDFHENGGMAEPPNETERKTEESPSACEGKAAARLHQLVQTGALDDFFACYQELRGQKDE